MITKIPVSELLPNPYRDLKSYEINEGKVEQLIASFKASGEWPGIIARRNKEGKYESAFGEHRKTAHRRFYGKHAEIEIIVLTLDDAAMLRFMANENSETWTGAFHNEMETVEQVVQAFAKGEIQLPVAGNQGRIRPRYAPSFISGGNDFGAHAPKSYTAQSVGQFLGWMQPSGEAQDRVTSSLAALEFIERGILTRRHFAGLGNKQAEALLQQIRAAANRTVNEVVHERQLKDVAKEIKQAEKQGDELALREASKTKAKLEGEFKERKKEAKEKQKKVADVLHTELKTGNLGYSEAVKVTDRIAPLKKALPIPEKFIKDLQRELWALLSEKGDKKRYDKIQAVITAGEDLTSKQRGLIASALHDLAEAANRLADLVVQGPDPKPVNSRRMALEAQ